MNIVHEQATLYLLKYTQANANSTMLHGSSVILVIQFVDIAGYIFSKLGDLII